MLDRTAYWSTEAKEYRLRNGREEYLEELRAEAMVELSKIFDKPPAGYRETVDLDSFEYRIVTEYSDGHVVEMEMALGPRQRVPPTDTQGMTLREAHNALQRDMRAQLNYVVEHMGREIKEPAFPARLLYQCTLTAYSQKLATLPDIGPARYFTIGEPMKDFTAT